MDAACFTTRNSIGVGAVLRDHSRTVVAACMKRIESPFASLVAEAMTVREGIRSMLEKGFCVDLVEIDSKLVSKAINDVIPISVIDFHF